MQVLAVLECAAEGDALERTVDRFVERLAAAGRVGVVRYDATIADGTPTLAEPGLTHGGSVTYDLGADGDWAACGTGLSITQALDALATDCDYAVLVGVETQRYPTVVVGDPGDLTERLDVVATGPDAGAFDVTAVLGELERAQGHETLESLVERVKASPQADRAGAIATFTGRVRAKDDPEDDRTEYLEFEAYEGVADERLAAIRTDLEARDGVYAVELYHRTGVVRDGEDIVFVVVLAGHRAEAFETVEDGIDRLKAEVPLFKKEVTVSDEFWVHERE